MDGSTYDACFGNLVDCGWWSACSVRGGSHAELSIAAAVTVFFFCSSCL